MSKFGWDLPPGVTQRMIDEAYGHEEPCEVCGKFADECICPECPICGEVGRPECYGKIPDSLGHGLAPIECGDDFPHGLELTPEQIAGRRQLDDFLAEEKRREDRIADHIDGYDRDDLGESPDY